MTSPAYVLSLETRLAESEAQVTRLQARVQELLTLCVKVTNETPYPEELQGWEAQRRAFIAERGTLKARIVELEQKLLESNK